MSNKKKYNIIFLAVLGMNPSIIKNTPQNQKTALINKNYNDFTFENDENDDSDDADYNDFLDQDAIGSGAGQLHQNNDGISDVVTFGGMVRKPSRATLLTKSGFEISLTGKERVEGSSAINTKYLNNANLSLDSYLIPGKSTTDFGIMAAAGKHTGYDYDVIILGADFRSRTTWGKPQDVGKTTSSTLTYNDISYGSHSHTIGIPIVYLRGVDLTLNLNGLFCNLAENYPIQKLKLGLFPFEIGRGISLGAAYLISSDILSYAPVDVIQEFAPGFMLYGDITEKNNLSYRLYLGIIKNLSGTTSDLIEKTKINQYKKKLFPYRGTGVFNLVGACQIDWKCFQNDFQKVIISPYIIGAHEGAGKVLFPEDSVSNVLTYGLELAAENRNNWDLSFEFAKNIGSQYVFGIDTNTLVMEQRTCNITGPAIEMGQINENINNKNTTISVITNSAITFEGYNNISSSPHASITTDIVASPATYLGSQSNRQKAIDRVYQDNISNGTTINLPEEGYTLKNSQTRFRNPYQNKLNGFMLVCDIAKTLQFGNQDYKLALAFGYASGGRNPNKDLIKKNDHIQNLDYDGFVGIQEIYSGKMVRSAFLMSGAARIPRIYSVPNAIIDSDGNIIETVAYPSQISGFNNLMYLGSSINFIYEGKSYKWKWFPNILLYIQPSGLEIYHQKIIDKLGKNQINPFLGTEINLFLEILSKNILGFKIFLVGSMFIPGGYYNDIKYIPLDKKQENCMYGKQKDNSIFIPLYNNNNAYYLNLGLEFAF